MLTDDAFDVTWKTVSETRTSNRKCTVATCVDSLVWWTITLSEDPYWGFRRLSIQYLVYIRWPCSTQRQYNYTQGRWIMWSQRVCVICNKMFRICSAQWKVRYNGEEQEGRCVHGLGKFRRTGFDVQPAQSGDNRSPIARLAVGSR